jgi:hypothetical protein
MVQAGIGYNPLPVEGAVTNPDRFGESTVFVTEWDSRALEAGDRWWNAIEIRVRGLFE